MTKYIFVTGGVLSSVGKGVATASIGKMFQVRSFRTAAVKVDPYVNVDAGTMNPFMHGEVFVTDDGAETDLDLGWYERFLDTHITRDHYITTGQIYGSVINKEREGEYLGKCVQIVPHVTDEIKRRIRLVAEKTRADMVLTEIGGTTGDIEGLPFLEAIRQLRLEEGHMNTLFVHVALVPILETTKEQKTKPLQHSVNELRRIGIQPDVIVARCPFMVESDVQKKIALFANVEGENVFCSPTVSCVYELPIILDSQGMGDRISQRLSLPRKSPDWSGWQKILDGYLQPKNQIKIAMCGKYTKLSDSYVSINEALKHAGASLQSKVIIDWIETEKFEDNELNTEILEDYDGILVPPGFGVRGTEGKIMSIRYAREHNIPFLGICFGFQMSIIEFSRNMCEISDANSVENNPDTPNPVLDYLPEQKNLEKLGGTMRLGAHEIRISPGTLAYQLYKTELISERHRHRFEVNPAYWKILTDNGLILSGVSADGKRIEIAEYPANDFHLGTQFHPEFTSTPSKPNPTYYGFVAACLKRKNAKQTVTA